VTLTASGRSRDRNGFRVEHLQHAIRGGGGLRRCAPCTWRSRASAGTRSSGTRRRRGGHPPVSAPVSTSRGAEPQHERRRDRDQDVHGALQSGARGACSSHAVASSCFAFCAVERLGRTPARATSTAPRGSRRATSAAVDCHRALSLALLARDRVDAHGPAGRSDPARTSGSTATAQQRQLRVHPEHHAEHADAGSARCCRAAGGGPSRPPP
jgi:hypothetical protein